MATASVRRSVLRHGFIVLLIAFLTGFGIVAGGPRARGWMAVHMTLMLSATFIVLIGLVWDELTLSARQRTVLRFAAVFNGYWAAAFGTFATIFEVPGPVSGGGAQPTGWTAMVTFTAFLPILTTLPFVFTGLVIRGLRGSGPTSSDRSA